MYKIWICCSLKSVEEREEAREGREEAREEDERNWLPDVKGITPCIASYETIPMAGSPPSSFYKQQQQLVDSWR